MASKKTRRSRKKATVERRRRYHRARLRDIAQSFKFQHLDGNWFNYFADLLHDPFGPSTGECKSFRAWWKRFEELLKTAHYHAKEGWSPLGGKSVFLNYEITTEFFDEEEGESYQEEDELFWSATRSKSFAHALAEAFDFASELICGTKKGKYTPAKPPPTTLAQLESITGSPKGNKNRDVQITITLTGGGLIFVGNGESDDVTEEKGKK